MAALRQKPLRPWAGDAAYIFVRKTMKKQGWHDSPDTLRVVSRFYPGGLAGAPFVHGWGNRPPQVYAYLTLQQRLVEFAIVRALGLSARQLQGLLLCEQVVVLAAGVCGGVVTGVLATRLFLPYLPITVDTMPPFVIVLPWLVVGRFILTVLAVSMVVLGLHGGALLRLRLGRVLRLGEG